LLGLDPPNRDHKDFLLKNGVTIGPRGHIFVDIAAYNEGTSQAKPGPWIRLLIPIPGGYLFSSLPGNLPITPHTFHLRFSSLEGGTLDEVYCGSPSIKIISSILRIGGIRQSFPTHQ